MTSREKYEQLLRKLAELYKQGKDESIEADDLRDEMDKPWHEMTYEDQLEMRRLSAELYDFGSNGPSL